MKFKHIGFIAVSATLVTNMSSQIWQGDVVHWEHVSASGTMNQITVAQSATSSTFGDKSGLVVLFGI